MGPEFPVTLETLAYFATTFASGAAGAWAVAGALGRRSAREAEAALKACRSNAQTLITQVDLEKARADRLSEQVTERDELLGTLQKDLEGHASPAAAKMLDELRRRLNNFDELCAALEGGEDEVWKLRPTQLPNDFYPRMHQSRTKVITVINYKGGVGKTTLVAGLAGYLSKRGKRVLVIDFDYQGSLTRTLILGARLSMGKSIRASQVLSGDCTGQAFSQLGRELDSKLPGCSLITCGQSFDAVENRVMLRWLLGETTDDVRFRLANLVLSEEIQSEFEYVLIDAPPRSSTGAINALCASHAILVPTVLDALSVDAVGAFFARASATFRALNPFLEYAGVVGTLLKASTPNDSEAKALNTVRNSLHLWTGRSHLFAHTLRHFVAVSRAAGQDIAYLEDRQVKAAFDAIGDELMGELSENRPSPSNTRSRSSSARDQWRGAESPANPSV